MSHRTASSPSPFALEAPDVARLDERVRRAIAWARRNVGPAFASVTMPVPAELDMTAAVLAARTPEDRWFCLEQPDRAGFALATLGAATVVEAEGPGRFAEASRRARELARRVFADDLARDSMSPPGTGPLWVGGFAFAADGGRAPEWSSLRPAQLVLPEVALARRGDEARLSVCARVDPDDDPESVLEGVLERLRSPAAGLDAADRPGPGRTRLGGRGRPAVALRRGRSPRRRAHPRRRAGQGGAGPRGARARARADRPGPGARRPARRVPGVLLLLRRHAGAGVRGREPGAARAARGSSAPRPWRSPAPSAAAPTRPWTITSASSCA